MCVDLDVRVADDNGEAREQVTVYRGTKLLSTLASPLAAVPKTGEIYSVRWRIPLKRAADRFCVVATDRGGKASDRSCAAIRVE